MKKEKTSSSLETALLACGCFWCLEAQFQHLPGVIKIEPGFTGGHVPNPSYEMVCTGTTGHAETCKITFDSKIISYKELLLAFFHAHDPTQLNRQGNDIGTQYRSAIFYLDESQRQAAEACLFFLRKERVYDQPVVTQIEKAGVFYPAEEYHKNYYNQHGENPYCTFVVAPKEKKFLKYLLEKQKREGTLF